MSGPAGAGTRWKVAGHTVMGRRKRWASVMDSLSGLWGRHLPGKRRLQQLQTQLSSVASSKAELWRAPSAVVEPKHEPSSAAPLARPAPMRKPIESTSKLIKSPSITDKTKRTERLLRCVAERHAMGAPSFLVARRNPNAEPWER
jgi:hypothetical protein